MKLYDFSLYARKRDERNAATAVVLAAEQMNEPGAVLELKARVQNWMVLHREILESRKVG